ncbi:MAG: hypothetical protein FWH38_09060, partial [Treponema sp.]|nr:hypothetical protein [Treponema sp.]
MELEIVRADPAGNITVFVLNPPDSPEKRAEAVRAIMADPGLHAEQVGFVLPPEKTGGNWRLEMMGGEFCGNAGRSFALLAAAEAGLSGRHTLTVEVSGLAAPAAVNIDTEARTAEIEIKPPLEDEAVVMGRRFPVYLFEGITHVIAENAGQDEKLTRLIMRETEKQNPCEALGIMYYDSAKRFMRPVVWVKAADTLVYESSCGSGTAALGAWITRNITDAETEVEIKQPGG